MASLSTTLLYVYKIYDKCINTISPTKVREYALSSILKNQDKFFSISQKNIENNQFFFFITQNMTLIKHDLCQELHATQFFT